MAFWKCRFGEVVETLSLRFANRKNTFGEGVSATFTLLLLLRPLAWSGDRSTEISFVPRCTSSSCAAAGTLRITTVEKVALRPPHGRGLAVIVTCEVTL